MINISNIDILYLINDKDVINEKQWRTRVLYNAYPPFIYNFVIDTHVFPCDSHAVGELFSQFKASTVDLSYGNRHMDPDRIMGSGILFKYSENTKNLWLRTYEFMSNTNVNCDQYALYTILSNSQIKNTLSIKYLSFNWNFCTMKINELGEFNYNQGCYISSLPVNSKVRFVHGSQSKCTMINGKNDEYINMTRVYFYPGKCRIFGSKSFVQTSYKQLASTVYPYKATNVNWQKFSLLPRNSIFWPYRDFCKKDNKTQFIE